MYANLDLGQMMTGNGQLLLLIYRYYLIGPFGDRWIPISKYSVLPYLFRPGYQNTTGFIAIFRFTPGVQLDDGSNHIVKPRFTLP